MNNCTNSPDRICNLRLSSACKAHDKAYQAISDSNKSTADKIKLKIKADKKFFKNIQRINNKSPILATLSASLYFTAVSIFGFSHINFKT